jgi:hypothetical protein
MRYLRHVRKERDRLNFRPECSPRWTPVGLVAILIVATLCRFEAISSEEISKKGMAFNVKILIVQEDRIGSRLWSSGDLTRIECKAKKDQRSCAFPSI